MTTTSKIIGSVRTYRGTAHPWATGRKVKIIAVLRDATDDSGIWIDDDRDLVGGLRDDDVIEFAPEVNGRPSFATSDATRDEIDWS